MCGRYSIYESMDHYLQQLELDLVIINGYDHEQINRYNVAPTTKVELIHPADGGLRVDKVRWGWAPHWAKGKRPDPINARVETVASGKFFSSVPVRGTAIGGIWARFFGRRKKPAQPRLNGPSHYSTLPALVMVSDEFIEMIKSQCAHHEA